MKKKLNLKKATKIKIGVACGTAALFIASFIILIVFTFCSLGNKEPSINDFDWIIALFFNLIATVGTIIAIVIAVKAMKQTDKQIRIQGNIDLFTLRREPWSEFCEMFFQYKDYLSKMLDKFQEKGIRELYEKWNELYFVLRPKLTISYGLFDENILEYMKNLCDAMFIELNTETFISIAMRKYPDNFDIQVEIERFETIKKAVEEKIFVLSE